MVCFLCLPFSNRQGNRMFANGPTSKGSLLFLTRVSIKRGGLWFDGEEICSRAYLFMRLHQMYSRMAGRGSTLCLYRRTVLFLFCACTLPVSFLSYEVDFTDGKTDRMKGNGRTE
ncbi:hypothetical protein VTL71DRAFT_1487 [Oculimacula yallundae]|uniref:Uncharacterized protein n=1 Tax=Oculimacula yallundae TaxID=86028 RepID=A0ABR4CAT6_9HELO